VFVTGFGFPVVPEGTARRFDLVIFDSDGVLVDSEPLVNRVYVDLMGELGHHMDEAASLREFSGASMTTRLDAFSRRFAWSPTPDFEREFQTRLAVVVASELKPVAGIDHVLQEMRVPICAASNGTTADIRARLGAVGLMSYFRNAIFSAPELGRPKPAPDVFLQAARAFGAEPSRCAVVEDSVTGVQGGVAAGMTVFGFAAHSDAAALQEAGATTFARMDDLFALLNR
jgi:HAD superfamily hydrolase (TIGR01509 family)